MKQIIIRQFPSLITVQDFIFGEVVDGQFAPLDFDDCPFELPEYVHRSNLLGTAAYIESKDIYRFVRDYLTDVEDFVPYPGYLVYTLKSDDDEKKTCKEA